MTSRSVAAPGVTRRAFREEVFCRTSSRRSSPSSVGVTALSDSLNADTSDPAGRHARDRCHPDRSRVRGTRPAAAARTRLPGGLPAGDRPSRAAPRPPQHARQFPEICDDGRSFTSAFIALDPAICRAGCCRPFRSVDRGFLVDPPKGPGGDPRELGQASPPPAQPWQYCRNHISCLPLPTTWSSLTTSATCTPPFILASSSVLKGSPSTIASGTASRRPAMPSPCSACTERRAQWCPGRLNRAALLDGLRSH